MRHALALLTLCAGASHASADCPARPTITAFGHSYESGGLIASINNSFKDCEHKEPEWLAKIDGEPAPKGPASASKAATPGLQYCKQIALSKEPQYEAQRNDCIFWYGHSIEMPSDR